MVEPFLQLFWSKLHYNNYLNGLRSFAVACFLLIPKDVNKL